MITLLSPTQLDHWRSTGWLHLPGAVSSSELGAIDEAIDRVAGWADDDAGPGLHHWELTEHGPALARSEELVDDEPVLREFIVGDRMLALAGALFGEPALLFKEKVNYKHPGGAGFAPHQDASAYRFVDHHVSCMVALDPATEASGCLSVASGHHAGLLPTEPGGRVRADAADALTWEPVQADPGDLVWFDSYTPHRSGPNTTARPRRALYLTYNAATAGDARARYYADKRAEFADEGGTFAEQRVRVSINDDFLGRPVPRPVQPGVSSP